MTKRYLLAAACLLAASSAAHAEDGFYAASSVSAYLGNDYTHHPVWTSATIDVQKRFGASLAAGYRLDDFRFELEGGFGRLADVKGTLTTSQQTKYPDLDVKGDLSMWTALAGAYVDFPVTRTYQPYVGLGAGIADVSNDSDLVVVKEGAHLATFGEAGLNIVVYDGLTIAPAYRFMWINTDGGDADNINSHQFRITARFNF